MAVYTELLAEQEHAPHRLGRLVEHDDRSLAFGAPVLPRPAIRSKKWAAHINVLDQGSLGSCVGNAFTRVLGSDPLWDAVGVHLGLDEQFAVGLYSEATRIDPFPGSWPPNDTGTSALAAAKVLQRRHTIPGYTHAFSLQAVLSGLQSEPVAIGIPWFNSMFTVAGDGHVNIDENSGVAGGHEVALDQLDVEAGRVWLVNSWGDGWGQGGRAWLEYAELSMLLSHQGDATVLGLRRR